MQKIVNKPDFTQGKKIVIEGEFTIVSKNENDTNFFTIQGKTFTLESHTKAKERYVVQVSERIYQSYLVNDKIRATLEYYQYQDTNWKRNKRYSDEVTQVFTRARDKEHWLSIHNNVA